MILIFPGLEMNGCTMADSDEPWCSTQNHGDMTVAERGTCNVDEECAETVPGWLKVHHIHIFH